MRTNGTNPGMNVDDYENMAVQKSNTAKRVAAGAAVFAGGAAVAGGAAYAAGHTGTEVPEMPLTAEDVKAGADVASTYQEEMHETHQVVHEQKVVDTTPEQPKEEVPNWEETTELYVGDQKVATVESGTYKGHKFALYDIDGDDHADALAYDVDGNGRFDDNEIQTYEHSDHIHMGHDTAHTTEKHLYSYNPDYAYNGDSHGNQGGNENIQNDFSDEKTGEAYHDDLADNNEDYNSHADTDNYEASVDNDYLAETDNYQDDSTNYGSADYNSGEEFLG